MAETIDPDAHDRLLSSVRKLDAGGGRRRQRPVKKVQPEEQDVDAEEMATKRPKKSRKSAEVSLIDQADDDLIASTLLSSLPSTALASDELKRHVKSAGRQATLKTPLHKHLQMRAERSVAYSETRKDMQKWQEIVINNRVADQLTFPINNEKLVKPDAVEQFSNKEGYNDFERKTREILEKSAHHLSSTSDLTASEKRILEAVSATDSREKMGEMRRLRILMGAKEAKMRKWKKVKSKSFHRRMVVDKRKTMLKEYAELQHRDPAAAQEKMDHLEKDRVLERATLRHRGTGKWAKALRQASRNNPELRDMFQSHIRDAKIRLEKQFDDDDEASEARKLESQTAKRERQRDELDKMVEAEAERLIKEQFLPKLAEKNPTLKIVTAETDVANGVAQKSPQDVLRNRLASLRSAKSGTTTALEKSPSPEPVEVDEPRVFINPVDAVIEEPTAACRVVVIGDSDDEEESDEGDEEIQPITVRVDSAPLKPTLKMKANEPVTEQVDDMFAQLNALIVAEAKGKKRWSKKTGKKVKKNDDGAIQAQEEEDRDGEVTIQEGTDGRRTEEQIDEMIRNPEMSKEKKMIAKKSKKEKKQPREKLIDIGHVLKTAKDVSNLIDLLNNFKMKTTTLPSMEDNLLGEEDDKQGDLIAEAFEDDDVVAQFEKEKGELVDSETTKDIDLSLPGWGTWAGAGAETMSKKKRKRFTIKAPTVVRKDAFMPGVIISERVDDAVKKHQARSLPFPYKSVAEYEAQISQPLGAEWMPAQQHQALTQPKVRTVTGRIIRPMHKETALKNKKKKIDSKSIDGEKK